MTSAEDVACASRPSHPLCIATVQSQNFILNGLH